MKSGDSLAKAVLVPSHSINGDQPVTGCPASGACPWSNQQWPGACSPGAELIHWGGAVRIPPPGKSISFYKRTLGGLTSEAAPSNMAHGNIFFALPVCCFN